MIQKNVFRETKKEFNEQFEKILKWIYKLGGPKSENARKLFVFILHTVGYVNMPQQEGAMNT